GGVFTADAGLTSTVTSSATASAASLAISRSTYVPGALKLAVVVAALRPWKVTVPGPLTTLHDSVVKPGGLGRPSSLTVPRRMADDGCLTLVSEPAETTGAALACPPIGARCGAAIS